MPPFKQDEYRQHNQTGSRSYVRQVHDIQAAVAQSVEAVTALASVAVIQGNAQLTVWSACPTRVPFPEISSAALQTLISSDTFAEFHLVQRCLANVVYA